MQFPNLGLDLLDQQGPVQCRNGQGRAQGRSKPKGEASPIVEKLLAIAIGEVRNVGLARVSVAACAAVLR
jgi:hypothetical protein